MDANERPNHSGLAPGVDGDSERERDDLSTEPLAPGWVWGAAGALVMSIGLTAIGVVLWVNAVSEDSTNAAMRIFGAIFMSAGGVFWLVFLTVICTVVALRVYESRRDDHEALSVAPDSAPAADVPVPSTDQVSSTPTPQYRRRELRGPLV